MTSINGLNDNDMRYFDSYGPEYVHQNVSRYFGDASDFTLAKLRTNRMQQVLQEGEDRQGYYMRYPADWVQNIHTVNPDFMWSYEYKC